MLPPTIRSSARRVKATGSSLKGTPQFVGRARGPRVPHTDWKPKSSSLNSDAEKHIADILLHQRPGLTGLLPEPEALPRDTGAGGGPEPSTWAEEVAEEAGIGLLPCPKELCDLGR